MRANSFDIINLLLAINAAVFTVHIARVWWKEAKRRKRRNEE